MLIQNTSTPFTEHVSSRSMDQSAAQAPLGSALGKLLDGETGLRNGIPGAAHNVDGYDVNRMLAQFAAKQKADLLQEAGSSRCLHLEALGVLEQRGFQPIQEGALKIRLTAKALGGGKSRESLRADIKVLEISINKDKETIRVLTGELETLQAQAQKYVSERSLSQAANTIFSVNAKTFNLNEIKERANSKIIQKTRLERKLNYLDEAGTSGS